MKKEFIKSVAAGIFGISLITGCQIMKKESSHKCSSNGCNSKKESNHKCSSNGCNSKKESNHKCSSNGCNSKK